MNDSVHRQSRISDRQLERVERLSDVAVSFFAQVLHRVVVDLYLGAGEVVFGYEIHGPLQRLAYILGGDRFELEHAAPAEQGVVYIEVRILSRAGYKRYLAVFGVFKQRLLLFFIKVLYLVEI